MKMEIMNIAAAAALAIGVPASARSPCGRGGYSGYRRRRGAFQDACSHSRRRGSCRHVKAAGPFTVFGATDAAFAKLRAGAVENLLKPKNKDELTAVLAYHIVAGKVMAADVVKLSEAKTVNGASVKIAVHGDKVMANDATVSAPDVAASNGVIHIIDTVLLPPAE